MFSTTLVGLGAFALGFTAVEVAKLYSDPKRWQAPVTMNAWAGIGAAMLAVGLRIGA